jgi:hypothetical protein
MQQAVCRGLTCTVCFKLAVKEADSYLHPKEADVKCLQDFSVWQGQ